MTFDLITLGCVTDVADVQMSGKKKIGPDFRKLRHRHAGASDQMFDPIPFRKIERMMRDDHSYQLRRQRPQPGCSPGNLV
jgi:hypothetical protein